jgi:hypothetical protein
LPAPAPPPINAVFADTWDIVARDLTERRPLFILLASPARSLDPREVAATERLRGMISSAYDPATTIGAIELWRRR